MMFASGVTGGWAVVERGAIGRLSFLAVYIVVYMFGYMIT